MAMVRRGHVVAGLGFAIGLMMTMMPAQAQSIGPAVTDPDALAALVQQCAPCHGADGIARDTEIPNLAGQHDRYLWAQMMAFRKGTRRHEDMRYMSRHLSEADIAALVAYYAALPR